MTEIKDTNGTVITHGDLCLFWDKKNPIKGTEETPKVKGKFDRFTRNWDSKGYRVVDQAPEGLPFECCEKL